MGMMTFVESRRQEKRAELEKKFKIDRLKSDVEKARQDYEAKKKTLENASKKASEEDPVPDKTKKAANTALKKYEESKKELENVQAEISKQISEVF